MSIIAGLQNDAPPGSEELDPADAREPAGGRGWTAGIDDTDEPRDALMHAVAQALRCLLIEADFDRAVHFAARTVAEAADLHRFDVVLTRRPTGAADFDQERVYEWRAARSACRASQEQTPFPARLIATLVGAAGQGRSRWLGVGEAEEPLRELFRCFAIQAIGFVPIIVDGLYAGFVCLADCDKPRSWTPREVEALTIAAQAIGTAIHRRDISRRLADAAAVRDRIARFLEETLGLASAAAGESGSTIDAVVTGVARELGAVHVFLFRYEAGTGLIRLRVSCIDGVIRRGMSAAELALWGAPFRSDVTPAWDLMTRAPGLYTPDLIPIPPEEFGWPGALDYARRFGLSDMGHIVLFADNQPIGSIGFSLDDGRRLRDADRHFIEGIIAHVARVIRLIDLGEESERTALLRQQNAIAAQKAGEAERSSTALQATVDALQDISEVEEIVPRVLSIVAGTFGAEACAAYENDPDGVSRLQYWHTGGQTMTPPQLLESGRLDHETADVVRTLAEGFTVPNSYLGAAAASAIGVFALDHQRGTSMPTFDQFAIKNRWDFELNIGVGSQGVRRSTLCIYRRPGHPFTAAEKALAESLAKQMALAIGLARLAAQARHAALALERQQAAEQRTADAARANDMLRRANERLAAEPELDAFVGHILQELCILLGPRTAVIFEHEPERRSLRLVASYWEGRVSQELPAFPWLLPGGRVSSEDEFWHALYATRSVVTFEPDGRGPQCRPEITAWMRQQRIAEVVNYPLTVGEAVVGFIGLGFSEPTDVDPVKQELAKFLVQQTSIAFRAARLATAARAASLLEERNRIARDLHDTMAQSFTGIYMQLQAASRYSESNQLLARECIDRAQTLARDGLREARRSVLALASAGEPMDLAAALASVAELASAGTQCPCAVIVEGEPRPVDAHSGANVVAICREALGNAQRYSEATALAITLGYRETELEVRITDNGQGFNVPESTQSGFGLAGMYARAQRVGGTVQIVSAPGAGTTVILRVPAASPAGRP